MSVTHFICPGCGAEIRVGSKGCPKCTRPPRREKPTAAKSWEHDEVYDGLDLDLPEDDSYDYDDFVAREFGGPEKRSRKQWLWWGTAAVLLIVLAFLWI